MVDFKTLAILITGAVIPVLGLPFDKRAPQAIPNKYIVTLKPGFSTSAVNTHLHWVRDVHRRSLSRRSSDTTGIEQVYNIRDFNAYAGSFDADTIREIEQSEDVAAIEPDMIWHLYEAPSPNPPTSYFHPKTKRLPSLTTQLNAPWGLGSISHRTPNSTDYIYDPAGSGAGTYAYVIDTGIRTTHVEFEGRVQLGFNAVPNTTFDDHYGHGTHVAGTIGSRAYGVAKKTTLVAVKVFDTAGSTTSIVLSGYTWAVNNITSLSRQRQSVISMSLGGPLSTAFNAAVSSAYASNVLSVVAAGNDGIDARNVSPASAPEALTVGAVDIANDKPWWSNFGPGVDIFAPGVDVLSCWVDGDGDEAAVLLEGTSMAAPHVTGLVLYLRGVDPVGMAGVGEVVERVRGLGTGGVVGGGGTGSPNLLAYNGNGA